MLGSIDKKFPWRLAGILAVNGEEWGSLSESIKKGKFVTKIEKKMISADVKANVKWQETKELVALSYKLLQELL